MQHLFGEDIVSTIEAARYVRLQYYNREHMTAVVILLTTHTLPFDLLLHIIGYYM